MFFGEDIVASQSGENVNHAHQNTRTSLLKGQSLWQQMEDICSWLLSSGETICFCVHYKIKNANIKFTVVLDIITTC